MSTYFRTGQFFILNEVNVFSTVLADRTSTGQVSESVKRVLLVVEGEMKSGDIQNLLQLKHRENFRDNYLIPALNEGILEMTIPDKPNSSKQKYRLTQKGIEMKMQRG